MRNGTLWPRLRPYAMVAPVIVGIVLFVFYPIAYLGQLSLNDYNLLNPAMSEFIGLENYVEIFQRGDFYVALRNTLVYTLGTVSITLTLAVLFALLLKRHTRLGSIVQAGIFIPHVISIVSISLVWLLMMEPSFGLINTILKALGLPTSMWLQSSETSMLSIIIVSVWHSTGYFTLIVLAALHSIPASLYEAAALDNAGPVRVFFKITLPMLSPQLFFMLIISTIGALKVFDTVNIMTGGGPNNSTTSLAYYIFQNRTSNIGYASASGIVLMVLVAVFTIIYFRILSKKVHYQ
ncbi:carbohydrate ABC transporter permease [Microbacterium lushaniae]|uniref:Sugar ABC transporter permease n=1 Tax=Microbacterium lushaniae TaxID=2614639 RepID=A0A5J5JDQ2_9MICO|nr:sugar ABC transporter permease [Microbacterium lushaniae]KAA9150808.1 sugar ABC transporter permease [Microbacterium lushaniae]KAA9150961.1 sugar ABC transporter permease [Microbacterium lushaniae]QEW03062.1 sugar ABC transporter permease [Microbacterium lushaniae]